MEPLQKQVLTLSSKVDDLYQLIVHLDRKVSQSLSSSCTDTIVGDALLDDTETSSYAPKGHINFNAEMEHKDVLVDAIYTDINLQAGDRLLTPEIQIQRLTAQLTAAYNRIAALEEQLLFRRIHS